MGFNLVRMTQEELNKFNEAINALEAEVAYILDKEGITYDQGENEETN